MNRKLQFLARNTFNDCWRPQLSLEETLLEPPALPPPPTRHALFVILIALAALLHVATIGSGDLYSQTEGQYAGSRPRDGRDASLASTHEQWRAAAAKTPLLYWLIIISFKLFGVNAATARLPVALAVVACAGLIFLIGEKLTDYWRGFIAGLIYLSLCGTFLLARIVMPEPLVSALIAGAIFARSAVISAGVTAASGSPAFGFARLSPA